MPHNKYLNWPSVSRVVKDLIPNPGVDSWKARVGEDKAKLISKEATDYGTNLHSMIEKAIKANRWPRKYNLDRAKKFVKEHPGGDVEVHCLDKEARFHGTIDYACPRFNCIADWKSGRMFDIGSFFQMLGYSFLSKTKDAVLIPVGEKAKYLKPCWFIDLNTKWPVWDAMVETWWKINPSGVESE